MPRGAAPRAATPRLPCASGLEKKFRGRARRAGAKFPIAHAAATGTRHRQCCGVWLFGRRRRVRAGTNKR
jgi:hypothetical protein